MQYIYIISYVVFFNLEISLWQNFAQSDAILNISSSNYKT